MRPGRLSDMSLRCPVPMVNAASLSTGAPVNDCRAGAPGRLRLMARPCRPCRPFGRRQIREPPIRLCLCSTRGGPAPRGPR